MFLIPYPQLSVTCLASLALLTPLQSAAAVDDAIIPDRPNFVDSTNVVGRHQWQIEMGAQAERDKVDGARGRTYSMPTLLRYGVGDVLELRLETDGRTVEHAGDDGNPAGYADSALGLKWHVRDAASGGPSVGLVLQADLPTGSPAWRGQGVRPSLRLTGEWELPAGMSLGVTSGAGQERNDAGGVTGMAWPGWCWARR